jgi:PKHD-type hydroxylase
LLYLFPERIETAPGAARELRWPAGVDPFGGGRPVELNSALNEVYVLPGALTPEECARAQALGEARDAQRASIDRGHVVEYRASTVAWIEPHDDAHWLYHRLAMLFVQANARYHFELTGFLDALQYTVYGPQDLFDWHIDLGAGATSARKLSVSLLLNAETEYGGGRLEFANTPRSGDDLPAGTAIFFPSYMMHRVSPITRGVRRSVVAWGAGAPFR